MTKQDILNAFREKFVLDMNKVIFGDPEELKKQGWEVGEGKSIIRQDTTPEVLGDWLLTALTEFEREAIEKLAEEYGDFRISKKNKKGRALRFYLLPHTKHKEGDDEER